MADPERGQFLNNEASNSFSFFLNNFLFFFGGGVKNKIVFLIENLRSRLFARVLRRKNIYNDRDGKKFFFFKVRFCKEKNKHFPRMFQNDLMSRSFVSNILRNGRLL